MRSTRFGALSISAVILAAAVVGGSAATAIAATAAPTVASHKVPTDFAEQIAAARAHGDTARSHRAAAVQRSAAADDPANCFTQYPDNADDPASSRGFAERLSGSNRYDVGVCVSYESWFSYDDPDATPDWLANSVVLARGDLYPDALAGGPLAAEVHGPLLLTTPTSLVPQVRTEIQRVLAPGSTVYLLGGTASISDGVKNTIASMGYNTVRIPGKDRYEVAVNIAKTMDPTNLFFFADGLNFPDALSAGTSAAIFTAGARYSEDPTDTPVAMLFTKGTTMAPASANYAVQQLHNFNNYWGLYTAGGAGDTATVKAFGVGNIQYRFTGHDRYAVATRIAQHFFVDPSTGEVYSRGMGLVNGLNFPDALTGSGLFAQLGNPLLLTNPTSLSPGTRSFLQTNAHGAAAPAFIDVIGGPASVSDSVMFAARTAYTPPA